MDVVALGLANAYAKRRFASLGDGLSVLAKPVIFAHDFGANVVPDESLEGARAITALGASAIDGNTSVASDGSLPIMHDSTVDRTTTATGNTADLSAGRTQQLVIDAGSWFGGGWGNCRVPDFADLCREFGNKKIISMESKQVGSAPFMIAMAKSFRLADDMIFWQSFSLSECQVFAAAGYSNVCLLDSAATVTPAQMVSNGLKWIGLDAATASPTSIAGFHAVGVKVGVYTINRQADLGTWISSGVDVIWSDDPLYVTDVQTLRTTDPYSSQAYWNGQFINGSRTNKGVWSGTNEWGFSDAPNVVDSVVQGWAVPKMKANGNTVQIDFSFALDALFGSDTTKWWSWAICTADYPWTNAANAGINGYNFYLRGDGSLRIYRIDGGVTTQLGASTASGAPVLGAWNTARINITPTTLTWKRPDLGASNTVTATDSTYRNLWYPQAVRFGTAVRFRGVTLT